MSIEQKHPENAGAGGGLIGATKEARLEQRAIMQRWPFFENEARAVLAHQIEISIDPATPNRQSTSAARAVMSAMAQNQADEHKQQSDELNINLHGGVRIVEDDDWYGNADRLAAIAAAASGFDSDGPGPVQSSGGGPPVGKNGNGSAGGH